MKDKKTYYLPLATLHHITHQSYLKYFSAHYAKKNPYCVPLNIYEYVKKKDYN